MLFCLAAKEVWKNKLSEIPSEECITSKSIKKAKLESESEQGSPAINQESKNLDSK